MAEQPDTPSVVERTRPVNTGGAVVAVHFLGDVAVFVLGEENIVFAGADAEIRIPVHTGAILAAATDGKRIVTGGDDGDVIVTDAGGHLDVIATDEKRRWIDQVALGPDGAVAWSAGKHAFVKTRDGAPAMREMPSSIGGLAFAPKGVRLAIAHYNGVTLWFPNARDAKPEFLEWKGSHLGVAFSPDGKFVVTAMQEATLHGWRLADSKNMRMSGYASRIRSLDWSSDGKWLATSGSTQLILWPFGGKDGPMGKQPKMLAPGDKKVVAVACHPTQAVAAVGFDNGVVLLVRLDDGAKILARKPGDAPVSALAWNSGGNMLAIAAGEDAGLINLA